jgi:hypothetical protein
MRSEIQRQTNAKWLQYAYDRAILLAKEAHCLLSAGFPDGAMARVRCFAELTVCAFFINIATVNGYDRDAGQKYIDHEWIRRLEILEEQLAHYNKSVKRNPSNEEIRTKRKQIKTRFKEVDTKINEFKEKYGKDFAKSEYGWAYSAIMALNAANGKKIPKCGINVPCCENFCCENPCCMTLRVTLTDLINATGAQELKWIFEFGNKAVHAGAVPSLPTFDFPLIDKVGCFNPIYVELWFPIWALMLCMQAFLGLTYYVTRERKIEEVSQRHKASYNMIGPAMEIAEKNAWINFHRETS